MVTRRRIYELLAAVIMFFVGIAVQFLLGRIFPITNSVSFVLIVIVFVIAFILVIVIDMFSYQEKNFKALEYEIKELIKHTRVKIEYIEDNFDGKSYSRATELIEKASQNITFVSPWEPGTEYEPGIYPEKVGGEKRRYYEAIRKQIEKSVGKDMLFHRRIIQVPPEIFKADPPSLTYKVDSSFVDYLRYAATVQENHPHACRLRMVSERISSHFTIVDDRYVILSTYMYLKGGHSIRHGAIIIDDGQGEVIKYYSLLYQVLDAQSRPLESHHFILPLAG